MESALYQDVAPPVQGQIFKLAHTATAARYEVPPAWRGRVVTFTSTQSDLDISFGNGLVKVEVAEVSIVKDETLAANWATGDLVPAGASRSFPVPSYCTHFCVDSSGASGYWSAAVSSGTPTFGEDLDTALFGKPLLWLDAGRRRSITLASADVAVWRCRENGYAFSEATNRPAIVDAAAAAADMIRPCVSYTAGNSDKLVCDDATLSAALGGVNPFTLAIAARRGAAGALHTLFSVGTGGSNNGRWDFTLDASDDPIMTRVTAAGASTTSAVASTIASGDMNLYVWTFDGATPLYWQDRVATALTGTAAGNVGTTTKVAVGCRAYNTSTFDQFATAQIGDVIAFPTAFAGQRLDELLAWLKRRYGS